SSFLHQLATPAPALCSLLPPAPSIIAHPYAKNRHSLPPTREVKANRPRHVIYLTPGCGTRNSLSTMIVGEWRQATLGPAQVKRKSAEGGRTHAALGRSFQVHPFRQPRP